MRRAAGNAGLFTEPQKPLSATPLLTVENGVGIVSIMGVLMKRPDFFARLPKAPEALRQLPPEVRRFYMTGIQHLYDTAANPDNVL